VGSAVRDGLSVVLGVERSNGSDGDGEDSDGDDKVDDREAGVEDALGLGASGSDMRTC
jgi:hypothetical protein